MVKNTHLFSGNNFGKSPAVQPKEKHSLNDYLHMVLNSTREAIFLLNTAADIKIYNEYARQLILSFTGSDIQRVPNLIDAVPEWRKAAVSRSLKEAAEGKAGDYEVRYPSGRWLDVSFFPVRNKENNITEICCTLRDISERKNSEELVKKNEEMYRTLIESMQEGVLFQSMGNSNNLANKSAADILGLPVEILISDGLFSPGLQWIDQKGKLVDIEPMFCSKFKNHQSVRNVTLGLKKGEATCWLWINAEPVKIDHIGNSSGCLFTFTDITETLKNREELKMLSKVIKETSNMVVITDKDQKIIWANDSFIDTSEYTLEEALHRKPGHLLAGPEKDPEEVKKIRRAIQKAEPVKGEILNYTKSGKKFWANYNIHPVKDDEGQLIKYFSIQSDITELKRIQEEIVRQRLEHQELIAHATIVAQEEKQNQIGQELHDNINQVLAVAKMQLGPLLKKRDDHHKIITLVNEHIQLAIDEIRKLSHRLVAPQFSEKTMTGILENLKVIVPAPAKFRLRVQDDVERYLNGESRLALYRIAQEQLNNINKYANAANISIALHYDCREIFMIIQDDGIGFDTTIKRQGIGLRNIYTRAESLNGNAEIISSPGKGCKLVIKIPAVRSVINLD